MTDSLNDFDRAIVDLGGPFKKALIDVLDSAHIVRKWFACYESKGTPADIVAMTALVMAREGKTLNQFVLQPNHRVAIVGETMMIENDDQSNDLDESQIERIRNDITLDVRREVEADFKRLEAENKDLTNRLAEALARSRKLEAK